MFNHKLFCCCPAPCFFKNYLFYKEFRDPIKKSRRHPKFIPGTGNVVSANKKIFMWTDKVYGVYIGVIMIFNKLSHLSIFFFKWIQKLLMEIEPGIKYK